MDPNKKEVNDSNSHDAESNMTQLEPNADLNSEPCSSQPPTCGEKEADRSVIPLKNDTIIRSYTEKTVSTSVKRENDCVSKERKGLSTLNSVQSERIAAKKRMFSSEALLYRPVKRTRFAFDNDSRIGRIEYLQPISTNQILPCSSKKGVKCKPTADMFDDAEDDRTFDIGSYKKSSSSTSTIRADLVAAILGSSTQANTKHLTVSSHPNSSSIDAEPKRKRVTNKKPKKKSTEKERLTAVAILDGEVDLLRILSKDDCFFLGRKCFIFTLRQLEWVLGDDLESSNSDARQQGRKALLRILRQHLSIIDGSSMIAGNSMNETDQAGLTAASKVASVNPSEQNRINGEPKLTESVSGDANVKDSSINEDSLVAEKLQVWKKSIETWKQESSEKPCEDDQFPLIDGPMSVFFPVGTLRFIESIKVKSLFDFLCLKKTESGLVVEMFRAWRKTCGLRDINLLPLAKHLIGINARIEASLKRKLDDEADFASWVTGPMAVLSGAAKEFIVDYSKIFSGEQFIEKRTKTLADEFCEWRLKRGLSALRGSGNVAMISAWKTQIKDELEIENSEGKVVPEEEIENEVDFVSKVIPAGGTSDHDHESKRRRVRKPTPKGSSRSPAAHKALNSVEFFSRCFPEARKLNMFKSAGITTAQQLLFADKGKNSILLKTLIQCKSEQNPGKEIQVASCVSLLYDWSSRVKKRIADIEKGDGEVAVQPVYRDQKSKENRSVKKKSTSMNPFDALSKSSKEFLQNKMNISTASEFLETRTTDIANAFVEWRVDKGMPTLKGLGAVASISGWKKLVRTKAASLGNSNLAELNRARHTKGVVPEASTQGLLVEHRGGGIQRLSVEQKKGVLDNQFRTLGRVSDTRQGTAPTHLQSKNIISALSYYKDEIFHFELITRKDRSKGTTTYLRYLGADLSPSLGLRLHETSDYAMFECAVIKPDLHGKPSPIITSGRKYYDSTRDGCIELRFSGYDPGFEPKKQPTIEPLTLSFLMRSYLLLRTEPVCQRPLESDVHSQQRTKAPQKAFNVFGVAPRNGAKCFLLHHPDPIEKGQSIELQFLPLNEFDENSVKKGGPEDLRNLIEERLQQLPYLLLMQTLRSLNEEVAPSHDSLLKSCIERLQVLGTTQTSLDESQSFMRARRRAHWLAVKIHERLRNVSSRDRFTKEYKTDFFWTKSCIDTFRNRPEFKDAFASSIKDEIRQEINHEFFQRDFDGFATSVCIWCPLAKKLFSAITDIFADYASEVGGPCVGDGFVSKLSIVVSKVILELNNAHVNSQCGDKEVLSKIALTFGENSNHHSKIFPSFDDIKHSCYREPYINAMSLCDEPISPIDSIKEAQIVVTKRIFETTAEQTVRFEDLHDVKINEKNLIDIRWYVDTQVVAVALSAIRCGVSLSTPEDMTEALRDIECQIMETAHKVLAETTKKSLSFDDFKREQHIVDSILESEAQRLSTVLNRRSLMTPSSMPFFFGFIWPLLKEEGWKMIRGNAPTEVNFLYPVNFGGRNRISKHKESMASQRTQLARESSSLGLGYIPKLTKRLLIKFSEKNGNLPTDPAGPSTKKIIAEFSSSLFTKIEQNNGQKTGDERIKIERITSEFILLFNKLVALTFEKEDECHLAEGREWCDVLGCKYLFKFLIILPSILQEVDLPTQQYSNITGIVHELLTYMSNNYKSLSGNDLKLPKEEYDSEPGFPSTLPSQILNFSQTTLARNTEKEESEKKSFEAILPKDREYLTDFVTIVMSQTIIGRSPTDHSSRHALYRAGHPHLVCRHCLGEKKGGKYFYGSYDSIATAVTAVEKHILRCTKIDGQVRQDMMDAKVHHGPQRKKLPFGAQSAYFVRLFDRMQGTGQTNHEPEATNVSSLSGDKRAEAEHRHYSINHALQSHVEVMWYIQNEGSFKIKKPLEKMIDKYYSCLEYGGKLCRTQKSDSNFSSEWLYSKLKN